MNPTIVALVVEGFMSRPVNEDSYEVNDQMSAFMLGLGPTWWDKNGQAAMEACWTPNAVSAIHNFIHWANMLF